MNGLSILLPAYNEAGNIRAAVAGVIQAAEWANLPAYEIIVINDGSRDETGLIAERIANGNPRVSVLHHPTNLGLRDAYQTGLDAAQYEYCGWAPGDGEMPVESLGRIFAAIGSADLVIPYHGAPENRPWFRRALTWISTIEMNLLLGNRLNYYQGPVCYPTALARALPKTVPGFFFASEMLACAMTLGLSYVEVPLIHRERQYGVSKAVSWYRIWQAQMAVLGFWWRFRLQGQGVPVLASSVARST